MSAPWSRRAASRALSPRRPLLPATSRTAKTRGGSPRVRLQGQLCQEGRSDGEPRGHPMSPMDQHRCVVNHALCTSPASLRHPMLTNGYLPFVRMCRCPSLCLRLCLYVYLCNYVEVSKGGYVDLCKYVEVPGGGWRPTPPPSPPSPHPRSCCEGSSSGVCVRESLYHNCIRSVFHSGVEIARRLHSLFENLVPVSQSVSPPASQSVRQSISQSVNQLVTQSNGRPDNRCMYVCVSVWMSV